MDEYLEFKLLNRKGGHDYYSTDILLREIAIAIMTVDSDNETLTVVTKTGRIIVFQPDNIDRKMWPSEEFGQYRYVIIRNGEWEVDPTDFNLRNSCEWLLLYGNKKKPGTEYHYGTWDGFEFDKKPAFRKDGTTGAIMDLRP